MRILTVCNGGNVRSACLARMFKKRGHEAIPIGVDSDFSDETLMMMFNWADKIVIQKESALKLEKRALKGKEKDFNSGLLSCLRLVADRKFDFRFDLGKDDWYQPDHSDLVHLARGLADSVSLEDK